MLQFLKVTYFKRIACTRRIPPHEYSSIWETDTDGAIKNVTTSFYTLAYQYRVFEYVSGCEVLQLHGVACDSDRVTSGENNFSLLSSIRAKFLHTPLYNRIGWHTVRCA